jgi:hypothetical protein
MMARRNFEPCKPQGDPRFRGVRLLILGESHYGEDNPWQTFLH